MQGMPMEASVPGATSRPSDATMHHELHHISGQLRVQVLAMLDQYQARVMSVLARLDPSWEQLGYQNPSERSPTTLPSADSRWGQPPAVQCGSAAPANHMLNGNSSHCRPKSASGVSSPMQSIRRAETGLLTTIEDSMPLSADSFMPRDDDTQELLPRVPRQTVPKSRMYSLNSDDQSGVANGFYKGFQRPSVFVGADKGRSVRPSSVPDTTSSFGTTFEEEEKILKTSLSRSAMRKCEVVQDEAAFKEFVERPLWTQWMKYFEFIPATLVVLNLIFFGVEAEYMARNYKQHDEPPAYFTAVQLSFTSAFVLELVVRICFHGPKKFFLRKDDERMWNLFDTVIVMISMLDFATLLEESEEKGFAYLRMVRVVKSVRILRVVRMLRFFRSLRLLVFSVLNTLRSLMWTLTLLMILLYMFGVVFCQAATGSLTDTDHSVPLSGDDLILHDYYGSVPDSVYTLFKSITGGVDWERVARPLANLSAVWLVLFIFYLTFTYFAVLNVVTGVFCQVALEENSRDMDELTEAQQQFRERHAQQLRDLFNTSDASGSGSLSLSDFQRLLRSEDLQDYFSSLEISTEDAWSLFRLLDARGDGRIDMEEFVTGCLRLRGQARSVDIAMLQYQLRWVTERLGKFTAFAELSFARLRRDSGRSSHMHKDVMEAPHDFGETNHPTAEVTDPVVPTERVSEPPPSQADKLPSKTRLLTL